MGDTTIQEDGQRRRARARVGTTLRDRWVLQSLIGMGGMAAVYAAQHRNGKKVALKVLHPELSADEELRGRFLREGYVANQVEHPGTVSILDDDVAEDGSVFLVMDLLEGATVEERRERAGGKLSLEETLSIVDRLLGVLAAAHRKGIVHRDIKPENLFVTDDGALKVLDFGIARLRDVPGSTTATRTGSAMGTPAYMPPEQARGRTKEIDARTDLWAVGATAFTLLSGEIVHQGETVNEVLAHAITRPVRSLATVAPDVPALVARVIDRALAFDKEARWPDAHSMRHAFECAARGEEVDGLPPLAAAPVPTAPPSRNATVADAQSGDRAPVKVADGGLATTVFHPGSRRRIGLVAVLTFLALGSTALAGVYFFRTPAATPASEAPTSSSPSPPDSTMVVPAETALPAQSAAPSTDASAAPTAEATSAPTSPGARNRNPGARATATATATANTPPAVAPTGAPSNRKLPGPVSTDL